MIKLFKSRKSRVTGLAVVVAAGGAVAITQSVDKPQRASAGHSSARSGLPAGRSAASASPVVRYILTDAPAPPSIPPASSAPQGQVGPPTPAPPAAENGPHATQLKGRVLPYIPGSLTLQFVRDQPQPCGTAAEVQFGNSQGDLVEVTTQCLTSPIAASVIAGGQSDVTVTNVGSDQLLASAVAKPVPGVGSFYTVARSNSAGELVTITVSGGNGRGVPLAEPSAEKLAAALIP